MMFDVYNMQAPQESLKEWREIRRQQDLEYAQSLRTDQAKEYQKVIAKRQVSFQAYLTLNLVRN